MDKFHLHDNLIVTKKTKYLKISILLNDSIKDIVIEYLDGSPIQKNLTRLLNDNFAVLKATKIKNCDIIRAKKENKNDSLKKKQSRNLATFLIYHKNTLCYPVLPQDYMPELIAI